MRWSPLPRRMVYLCIKDICPSADEVIIVTSSLMKDMNNKTDLYRSNSVRVLCKIIDSQLLMQIERYLKQAIVDKSTVVARYGQSGWTGFRGQWFLSMVLAGRDKRDHEHVPLLHATLLSCPVPSCMAFPCPVLTRVAHSAFTPVPPLRNAAQCRPCWRPALDDQQHRDRQALDQRDPGGGSEQEQHGAGVCYSPTGASGLKTWCRSVRGRRNELAPGPIAEAY